MAKRGILYLLFALSVPLQGHAQVDVVTEAQVTASDGDFTPLWLNANKYGLSSLDPINGYVRVALSHGYDADSTRGCRVGYGLDVAMAAGFTSTFVVQQAYGELGWKHGLLTIGAKERPMELRDQELSSGAQTLGINARPVPSVNLSLPRYWNIPGLNGWLALKGHISYGWTTDDNWQKDFTMRRTRYTEHTMLHTKAAYLRIGKLEKPLSAELGVEMGCQFGGRAIFPQADSVQKIVNKSGLSSFLNALIPSGSDATDDDYHNKEGNHLGSLLLRLNYDAPSWALAAYMDHYFEDQSQLFMIDYDGYGSGADWDRWKHFRWMVYNISDMQLGLELKLKRCTWLNTIVAEYIHTAYQSGPVYHDHTRVMSDHLGGRDDYYNHNIFTGWQHWGQVMGNPLYRSPLYGSMNIYISNNRFTAWHVGAAGDPLPGLHYRLLLTWQRGLGTYSQPFLDPQHNTSLLAEVAYRFGQRTMLGNWSVKCAVGMDRGRLLGDNIGAQFTIARHGVIRKSNKQK